MKRIGMVALQVAAGILTGQFIWLVPRESERTALIMEVAVITLTALAVAMARFGRDSGDKVSERAEPKVGPAWNGHTVITASLRGCYEMVLQVNGDSTREELGNDTHLLHGQNFNMLVKRVDGTIHGTLEDGRKVEFNLTSPVEEEDTMSEDKGGTN